jgi:hypothetical protein
MQRLYATEATNVCLIGDQPLEGKSVTKRLPR